MGSFQHKDKNIDVYLQTSKQLYVTGEWVEGAVYINSRQFSPYTSLALKFQCWEQCLWSESRSQSYGGQSHTVTDTYYNKICAYSETLWLNNFGQSGVPQGHYTFPFKLLLPQGLPGSFKQNGSNYIGYSLIAELMPVSNSKQKLYPQSYQIPLNIDEPLRIPFGIVSEERINNPKCCGCCCNYGTVKILLSCDKNAIKPGDNIKVRAQIDNSHGKQKIKNIVFKLERNVSKISREGRQDHSNYDKLVLFSSEKSIPQGCQDTIEFQNSIPLNYSFRSTAIGTVISNYFTIRISSSMGCCSQAADSQIHLVYHSSTRQLQQVKKVTAPLGWNPIVAQPVVLNNLKPYIHKQQGNFMWQNRAMHSGIVNAGNLQQMGSIQELNGLNVPPKYQY